MKIICAACGKDLGTKPADNFDENAVSHGLCESCAFHFQAQVGMSLPEYLEGLDVPVVTVTSEGTINSANHKALTMLGKPPLMIQGQKGGNVFECENAYLPEGCGNTIHCSACTIRNTVMDTIQTGNPHYNVPAYLNQLAHGGSHRIELFISTEKKGGVVFLKIEKISSVDSE